MHTLLLLGPGPWDRPGDGPGFAILPVLFGFPLLLLVTGVGLLVLLLVRRGRDPALAVLRERFARGEITAEEYTERRRVLEPE